MGLSFLTEKLRRQCTRQRKTLSINFSVLKIAGGNHRILRLRIEKSGHSNYLPKSSVMVALR